MGPCGVELEIDAGERADLGRIDRHISPSGPVVEEFATFAVVVLDRYSGQDCSTSPAAFSVVISGGCCGEYHLDARAVHLQRIHEPARRRIVKGTGLCATVGI